jgi:hypothetical protein
MGYERLRKLVLRYAPVIGSTDGRKSGFEELGAKLIYGAETVVEIEDDSFQLSGSRSVFR